MAHIAISVMLVWLAINIAYVLARLRVTRSPRQAPDMRKPGSLRPVALRHRPLA